MIAAILITALYVGREVLVPLALAILMSFVLTPPLLFLRRLGLPRVLGVGLLVTSAFVFLVALGWLMSREVSQLAFDLPRYQSTLATKITQISKSTADSPAVRRIHAKPSRTFSRSLLTQNQTLRLGLSRHHPNR